MRTVLIALGVLLICHLGHTLKCYSCSYGTCLTPSSITCQTNEVCVTERSSVTEYLGLKKKGCTNRASCNQDTTNIHGGITVTTKTTCCESELCNSATVPKVSLITGICAILALWLAKMP
ncbi:CD59 glycoprotein-like [Discoglossus pictus]